MKCLKFEYLESFTGNCLFFDKKNSVQNSDCFKTRVLKSLKNSCLPIVSSNTVHDKLS